MTTGSTIGDNTFLSSKGSPTILPKEVIRATEEEKEAQSLPRLNRDLSRLSGIRTVENPAKAGQAVQQAYAEEGKAALRKLRESAIRNENMPACRTGRFAVLMEATMHCSLGQLTAAMFEVGGYYRRNL